MVPVIILTFFTLRLKSEACLKVRIIFNVQSVRNEVYTVSMKVARNQERRMFNNIKVFHLKLHVAKFCI